MVLPGDKSISHRYALLAALADGTSRIRNFSPARDCESTLRCLAQLGIGIERSGDHVSVHGKGLRGLVESPGVLDAENSGTTLRLLSGILAGQAFRSVLTGDDSLRRRPMDRIVRPLTQMGARVEAASDNFPPLTIHGRPLRGIDYVLPIPSAQVKSCVLLAGLFASGHTTVLESIPSRDHTEIALRHMGARVVADSGAICIEPCSLRAFEGDVPGDLSSAAFLVAAGCLVPTSRLALRGVGLNPTRTAFLQLLRSWGACLRIENRRISQGEPQGDLVVEGGGLKISGRPRIGGAMIPNLIDEIPVLAVLGTQLPEGLEVCDAAELRVKESDRIAATAENLRRLGAQVEELAEGFRVSGRQRLRGTSLSSFGDHRIAMAFAVAGLVAEGETVLEGSECVAVSYPEFFSVLGALSASLS